MTRIEYSSICVDNSNYQYKIDRARAMLAPTAHEFGIQLHNSIDRELYASLLPFARELPFTVHAPLFATRFVNLAASNQQATDEELDSTLATLATIRSQILFFHGFFLTEKPIPHDMRNYRTIMRNAMGVVKTLGESFIMDPAIFSEPLFAEFRGRFVANLARLKEKHPNLTIALENDFPGIGSGLTRPQEIEELLDDVWLDLGHLWCSSIVHGFDFAESVKRIATRTRILGVHLNRNLTPRQASPAEVRDSHAHLYLESEQDLKPVVRHLAASGVPVFTLEIVNGDEKDLEILLDWIG